MPESFANRCGSMANSKHACTMPALIESCPQPAHRVDKEPSYSLTVNPNLFFGKEGCLNFGTTNDILYFFISLNVSIEQFYPP